MPSSVKSSKKQVRRKQPAQAKEAPQVVQVEGDVDNVRTFEESLNRVSEDGYRLISVVTTGYKLLGFLAKQ